ncbi:DUF2634 domain-containing protein [Heyndrickxia oleronia]|uniref:DUF2634 domain-containing protein n=1 Tax=Heyndrickxia oleronia TaxID=38875 RepID=UPI00203C549D|nr:DUF2634 domain-containing protein [Heyndrickxia oleronia]MCM3239043.1 DUF2634 domain-containing protein [Heyndrickxia oleronia]
MRVTPDISFPEIYESELKPSLTYQLDFETGEIGKRIDGIEAIEQFTRKTITTLRYAYLIYPDDHGCEFFNLLGKGYSNDFIIAEAPRVISDALLVDDRINRVYDFEFSIEEDEMTISFTEDTVEGLLEIKEVVSLV